MKIMYINNDGGGWADEIEIHEATTVAALFAALAGSWPLFMIVAAALVGTSLFTGEIRPPKRRRR